MNNVAFLRFFVVGAASLFIACAASNSNKEAVEVAEVTEVSDATPSLDGMTFTVATGETGKEAGDPDTLMFTEGNFRSSLCDQYGFDAAPYEISVEGDAKVFTATTQSAAEGSMTWKGTLAGDSLEGEFVWAKEGQDPVTYWFKGKTGN